MSAPTQRQGRNESRPSGNWSCFGCHGQTCLSVWCSRQRSSARKAKKPSNSTGLFLGRIPGHTQTCLSSLGATVTACQQAARRLIRRARVPRTNLFEAVRELVLFWVPRTNLFVRVVDDVVASVHSISNIERPPHPLGRSRSPWLPKSLHGQTSLSVAPDSHRGHP